MSVQDIYNKLRTAPDYHPSSAELFDDFTLEPGDVISVQSDQEHYALPIFAQHTVWNGAAMVTAQSQGNEERKPLPALQRKLFASGRGGYTTQKEVEEKFKQYDHFIEETDERFSMLYTESEWDELSQTSHVTAYSQITQTAQEITTVVAKTGINSLGQGETLYSQIQQNANAITTKVSAGDISSTINQTAQSVLIQASKIDLQGYVTASDLAATNASITNLTSGSTTAQSLKTHLFDADTGFNYQGSAISKVSPSLNSSLNVTNTVLADGAIDLWHYHEISASESSGVITITLGGATRTAADRTANFNIADTAFYQNAVSAAYNQGYADGQAQSTKTVTAVYRDTTQNTTYSNSMYTVPIVVEFSDGTSTTSTVNISIVTGSYVASTKRYSINIAGNTDRSLDASAAYNAGVTDSEGIKTISYQSITQYAYENTYASTTEWTIGSGRYYLVTVTPNSGSTQRRKFAT